MDTKTHSTEHVRLPFRPDLEGLRGLAVLLVVLYHASIPFVTGGYAGVDVFYVLSGFFITGLIVSEVRRTGRLNFPTFYARRVRRLLPTASLVLIVTAIASLFILPPLLRADTGWDIITAAVNGINIREWINATDYLAADNSPSPVLHYWSLAVEEQFYLVWPLLVWLLARPGKTGKVRTSRVATGLGLVILASLSLSVWLTTANQPFAFFMLPTRAWELAIGGLLALAAHRLAQLPGAVKALAGWGGLAAIIATTFLYTKATPFPGHMALLPVLGTAGIIIGANSKAAGSILFDNPVMRALGRWSYSLYLWHWPVLVLGAAFMSIALKDMNPLLGLGLMAATVAISAMTYSAYEHPLRVGPSLSASNRKSFTLGAVMATLAVVAGAALVYLPNSATNTTEGTVHSTDTTGIEEAIKAGLEVTPLPNDLTPSLATVLNERTEIYKNGCHAAFEDTSFPDCAYGDPQGTKNVWLTGDSHAAQWFPALNVIAKKNHWRLTVHTRSACAPVNEPQSHPTTAGATYDKCTNWQRQVRDAIATERPDLVVVGGTVANVYPHLAAYQSLLKDYATLSSQVIALGDTPKHAVNVPECVSTKPNNRSACATPVDKAQWSGHLQETVDAAREAGVGVIETFPWLCTDKACPVVASNILLYRDTAHLTEAASLWLQPLLEEALLAQQ